MKGTNAVDHEARDLKREVEDLVDLINRMIVGLRDAGHPIPEANNKSFYLRCCWVLGWINKTASRMPDENVLEMRKLLTKLLPVIRDAGV